MSVMASFSSWHGEKLHGQRYLLTTVLKQRLGFTGFVVGDWNGHGQVRGCSNANCAAAFNAGIDMFMVPADFAKLYENTLAQVRDGTISEARLDDAVRRILRVKKESGLFEAGRPSTRPHAGRQDLLGAAAHRELARRAVRESLVLLKNERGLLPLSPKSRVLVAGPGANDISRQTGGWTLTWQGTGNSNADFPGATSIYDGIRTAVTAAGGSVELAIDGRFTQRPDVAIVVFGESPYAEFQGDIAHLQYEPHNGPDLALLRSLKAAGIPVVSIFLSGRPLWVNPHLNASAAFVAAWLPGSEGAGIADVLFRGNDGRVAHDFRGRLSYSWPRRADQTPLNVGDRVYDPLFAYGHGLSYASPAELPTLSEVSGLTADASAPAGVYYANGRPMAGYQRAIGQKPEALQRVEGLELFAPGLSPTIEPADRVAQGDASLLRWLPGQPGYLVVARNGPPLDLERESNGQLALSLLLRIGPEASGKLYVGMRDSTGRAVRVEITPILKSDGQWRQYRIACAAWRCADWTCAASQRHWCCMRRIRRRSASRRCGLPLPRRATPIARPMDQRDGTGRTVVHTSRAPSEHAPRSSGIRPGPALRRLPIQRADSALNPSPHPNFTVQKFNIGREGAPLLVVDNVLGNPEALLEVAIGKHYGDVASFYPGIRAKAPLIYQQFILERLRGVVADQFGLQPAHAAIHDVSFLAGDHAGRKARLLAAHPARGLCARKRARDDSLPLQA